MNPAAPVTSTRSEVMAAGYRSPRTERRKRRHPRCRGSHEVGGTIRAVMPPWAPSIADAALSWGTVPAWLRYLIAFLSPGCDADPDAHGRAARRSSRRHGSPWWPQDPPGRHAVPGRHGRGGWADRRRLDLRGHQRPIAGGAGRRARPRRSWPARRRPHRDAVDPPGIRERSGGRAVDRRGPRPACSTRPGSTCRSRSCGWSPSPMRTTSSTTWTGSPPAWPSPRRWASPRSPATTATSW